MTRSTNDIIDTITDTANSAVSKASGAFASLTGSTPDTFTDKLTAKAKAIDPKDFVPSRNTVAKAGTGAGILLAGAAALAVGAFALYFLKERSQEEAEFDLLAKEGDFELRRYKAHLIAETEQAGDRSEALDKGFRPLADYIFAKPGGRAASEDSEEKIAMTVPVTATSKDQKHWQVRFTMPSKYTAGELPSPADDVTVLKQPERHIAAIRFSGNATDHEMVEEKRRELVAWLNERGFTPIGDPEYAFYNAPVVPGFMRRNEVWIAIEAP